MSITCAQCDHEMPSSLVYDQTPCPECGNLITAYITKANGTRVGSDQAILNGESLTGTDGHRWTQR